MCSIRADTFGSWVVVWVGPLKGISSGPTHSTNARPNASARTKKRGKHAPAGRRKRTDAVRLTHSRPKCGREMGQRGQASGPRTHPHVPPRVRRGPTWQPHCLDPSSPPRVLASLRRPFGLIPRVVSLELMPPLAICAGLQCRRLDDRAGQRAASGQRHASYAFIKGTPSHAGHTHKPAAAVPPHPTSTP
jgi:hypothetical protein